MWERRGFMEWTEEWRVGWLVGWGVSPGWMEKVPIIGLLLKEISPFAKRGIGGVTRRFLLLFLVVGCFLLGHSCHHSHALHTTYCFVILCLGLCSFATSFFPRPRLPRLLYCVLGTSSV